MATISSFVDLERSALAGLLEAAHRSTGAPTKSQKRAHFDAAYAAHAVCACGHEQGYHDGEHCSGVYNCDCRGFRRVA